jgi:hypothetical protein
MIVGGFGLALRHQRVDESGERTLLTPIPSVRTTEDIDAILRLDLLLNDDKTLVLRNKLQELGYTPVEKARNFQFEKSDVTTNESKKIKIDLLSRVPESKYYKPPRVKGKHLHAYGTPEAIAVEDTPFELSIEGNNTTGELANGLVYLPHLYALLLLKLFAFRDEQLGKKSTSGDRTPYARKHGGDLYAILAMTTEIEYETIEALKEKYQKTNIGQEATQIVQEFFQDRTSVGALRVREAHPETTQVNLETFLTLIKATF